MSTQTLKKVLRPTVNNSFAMETSIRHVKIFPDKFRTNSEILSDLYIADYEFDGRLLDFQSQESLLFLVARCHSVP